MSAAFDDPLIGFDDADATFDALFSPTELAYLVSYMEANMAIWSEVLEGTHTAGDIMRIMAAALAGKVSGAGTGTEVFKGLDGTTDRVTSTVDDDGNRTNVVVDGA